MRIGVTAAMIGGSTGAIIAKTGGWNVPHGTTDRRDPSDQIDRRDPIARIVPSAQIDPSGRKDPIDRIVPRGRTVPSAPRGADSAVPGSIHAGRAEGLCPIAVVGSRMVCPRRHCRTSCARC